MRTIKINLGLAVFALMVSTGAADCCLWGAEAPSTGTRDAALKRRSSTVVYRAPFSWRVVVALECAAFPSTALGVESRRWLSPHELLLSLDISIFPRALVWETRLDAGAKKRSRGTPDEGVRGYAKGVVSYAKECTHFGDGQ